MKTTILVVDDESKVRSMLDEVLTGQGFRVVLARDGHEALFVAEHEQPDLILLDIMMPQLDGYQFLRRYRRKRNTPVIILTAKEDESDAVIGFELGADDYVIKPFRMRELIARIHAVLRRYRHQQQSNDRLEVGDVLLERVSRSVTVRGTAINLTPTEFNLLAILISRPDHVVSHQTLLELVDVRIRAQNAYEHVKDTNRKTDQYTSFSLNKRLANKFTKRHQVIKIAWEALHKLEAEGQIKILYPEDITQLIHNHGKKKIKRQASAIRDIMTKNHEILIEGQIPYRYEKETIIQLVA